MVLRPVSGNNAGTAVADTLNHEEEKANEFLASLEKMDVSTPEFDQAFASFERTVLDHARHEEHEEFPPVRERVDPKKLVALGTTLRAAEKIAPTHPHPSTAGSPLAQWTVGPFASLLDHALDVIKKVSNRQ
jgi:hypothetical protein